MKLADVSQLRISIRREGASTWLVAAGDLDARTGGDLVGAGRFLADLRLPLVEVDLTAVRRMDAAGREALDAALDALFEAGSLAIVAGPPGATGRPSGRSPRSEGRPFPSSPAAA